MKNILILALLIFPLMFATSPVDRQIAGNKDAPKVLKDSQIERKLKNGKVQKFNGNDYKIVRRGSEPKPKRITKIITKKIYVKQPQRKNSVMLYGGYGPTGLEQEGNRVRLTGGAVLGLNYSRKLNVNTRLGVMIMTNKSILGGVGFDF